jgi:hypothetical protein
MEMGQSKKKEDAEGEGISEESSNSPDWQQNWEVPTVVPKHRGRRRDGDSRLKVLPG